MLGDAPDEAMAEPVAARSSRRESEGGGTKESRKTEDENSLMPNGCVMAIAPPLGLIFSIGMSSSCTQYANWEAKASLICSDVSEVFRTEYAKEVGFVQGHNDQMLKVEHDHLHEHVQQP